MMNEEEDELQSLYNLLQAEEEVSTERLQTFLEMEELLCALQNGDDVVLTLYEYIINIMKFHSLNFFLVLRCQQLSLL